MRTDPPPLGDERRRVRSADGRRIGQRRAPVVHAPTPEPELPRKARRYADRLVFVKRIGPSDERAEDFDTNRLIARFQAGDREVFSELYLRYFDRVFGYLRLALRGRDAAEDATQQVFTQTLAHLARFKIAAHRPFRSWLFRVARNVALDELTRGRRWNTLEPGEVNRLGEGLNGDELAEEALDTTLDWIRDSELFLFVERLPERQRQILALTYLVGLSGEEIASLVNSTRDAVYQQRSRALSTLRARLTAVGRGGELSRRAAPALGLFRQAPVIRTRRYALVWQ